MSASVDRIATIYLSQLPNMRQVAFGMARTPQEGDDNAGLIGLVFMEARGSHDGRLTLTDWLCLSLRNAVNDRRKHERVRKVRELRDRPERVAWHMIDLWMDVSEDARTVARALLASGESPRNAVTSAALELTDQMSWRRFLNAVDELRHYLED